MSTFVTKIDPRGRSVFVRAAEEPAGPIGSDLGRWPTIVSCSG